MDEPINVFEKQFHTDLILLCTLFLTIFVSVKNKKRVRILKYFPLYAVTFSIGLIFNRLCVNNHVRNRLFPFSTYLDYFLTLLELIIFSNFYYQLIKNQIVKRFIILSNLLFVLFFILMRVSDKNFFEKGISESTQSIVYTLEAIILLILCLCYFYELFRKLAIVNLKNDPAFWVSTGLLFFMACTLPYSLLENYMDRYYPNSSHMLYSLFYLFYIMLFIMVIRAYLCNGESTK